jgi:hypothetical protein
MHIWLGPGLIAVGFGLIGAAVVKQRNKRRIVLPAGAIRPEFAAMGDIVRPLILFVVALFALKISLFYFIFGGNHYLTPQDFGGLMFVLAAYAGYLVVATQRPLVATENPREAIAPAPAPTQIPAPALAEKSVV